MKKRREELGLTQDEIVTQLQLEGLDIARSTLSQWEVGRYRPPMHKPEISSAIARAYRLKVDEVLSLSGYSIHGRHTSEGEKAASIVDRLDPEKRSLAIKLLEQL